MHVQITKMKNAKSQKSKIAKLSLRYVPQVNYQYNSINTLPYMVIETIILDFGTPLIQYPIIFFPCISTCTLTSSTNNSEVSNITMKNSGKNKVLPSKI